MAEVAAAAILQADEALLYLSYGGLDLASFDRAWARLYTVVPCRVAIVDMVYGAGASDSRFAFGPDSLRSPGCALRGSG
jgi:hypothetical protein